ncbi:MAG: SusD/RagB family nutrient-binding outer membrane lipoprotein [Flavobacteriaceae bacterium]|nr:SusD/RagB family nutrient-binding outer membrane lipoprotein [Flavobacteriaceae bacterium]
MKKYSIIIALAALVFSCSSDLESLNVNTKDPAAVPGESLFTGAQKNLADQMVTLSVNYNNTKLYAQYLQETTYTDESNYDMIGRNVPKAHWDAMYKDVLKDLNEAKKIINATTYSNPAEEERKANKEAVIDIIAIYAYANLVETFGDIPYSEALDINNLLPKYDDGLTVYRDLISKLTTTLAALDTSKGSFGDADRMYKGDTEKWKKFGGSLLLRMGIMLSDVDAALAKSTAEAAVASGVIESNADNANYIYMSAAPNTNPVHTNLVLSGRNDFVAAETIIDVLEDLNDPRLQSFFLPVAGSTEYKGGGIGASSAFKDHSHVTPRVQAAEEKGVLFDYAETEFLLAEAVARGYAVGGTAKEHYDAAITASFEFWEAANVATYLAQADIDYDTALAASTATDPWKEVIGTQKWIALFNRGMEAWTSIRLLDFPEMRPAAEAVSGYPQRYTYPIVEQTLNGTSYTAAAAAIGEDKVEQKLFWDKQ